MSSYGRSWAFYEKWFKLMTQRDGTSVNFNEIVEIEFQLRFKLLSMALMKLNSLSADQSCFNQMHKLSYTVYDILKDFYSLILKITISSCNWNSLTEKIIRLQLLSLK